ncbi:hypothetical protein M408DRAFT_299046 [Serendipita vermifera MAFF 305830]|uniref:Uncharacterized protein n=1 Tax=Serendipita vermifera MAFF 305830 TaxID=933852 RepID=A0A0C3APA3_SERVB|nr:hypothetical protein M408DRAFT_299046 [Serendipita vermifera MAFF 305830]
MHIFLAHSSVDRYQTQGITTYSSRSIGLAALLIPSLATFATLEPVHAYLSPTLLPQSPSPQPKSQAVS